MKGLIVVASMAMLVAACGGGGDGDDNYHDGPLDHPGSDDNRSHHYDDLIPDRIYRPGGHLDGGDG